MAFTVPDFPLPVDIYTGPWVGKALRVSTFGNLAPGRRVSNFQVAWDGGNNVIPMDSILLLPKLTDIRAWFQVGAQSDIVEVPAGSGRWYSVVGVEDFGKGFANEHRWAMISQIAQFLNATSYPGLFWPTPIP